MGCRKLTYYTTETTPLKVVTGTGLKSEKVVQGLLRVDPLAPDYPHNSPYAFSENIVINAIELEGLEKVYIFDQSANPNNKRQYTAEIYVVTDEGVINGPYEGSTFPNSPSSHNTLNEGTHTYNNESGHKGRTQKGLNIVDANGNRNASGTSPAGENTTMTNVNVHSGVKPEDDPAGLNRQNRGSAGCPTCHPDDAESFFENFEWNESNTNTGTSEGTIEIIRGNDATLDAGKNRMRQDAWNTQKAADRKADMKGPQ